MARASRSLPSGGREADRKNGRRDRKRKATGAGRAAGVGGGEIASADEALFNLMPDAIITANRNGTIRQVNRQCCAMFGYAAEELVGQPVEILIPEHARKVHAVKRRAYQSAPAVRPMGKGLELHGRRKDGAEFPVDIMITPVGDRGDAVLAVIRDATPSRTVQEKLWRLAYTDPLTGLPNRAALYNDLRAKVEDTSPAAALAVVLFDLDGFKEVNDTLGHSAGDKLLQIGTERVRAVADEDVNIYRLGGDEFVVTIDGSGDPARVIDVVTTMMEAVAQPFSIDGQQAFVSAAAGIAFAPSDGATVDELLANVDLALYQSKARDGNTYTFFNPTFRADAQARRLMGLKLRQALAEREFEIYFQPTVRLSDLPDLRLVGVEALLRWRENGRLIAPAAFIDTLAASPHAEEAGDWILRTACAAAANWRRAGHPPMRMGVNLFPSQFNDPHFASRIESILTGNDLPPEALQLEITESIALDDAAAAIAQLRRLHAMGLSLALDDFGTGYASLSFLTEAPLSHIKIDQSFVRGLPGNDRLASIVLALIEMAHRLGLKVTAEGVETQGQADFLRRNGCDEAQGHLFSRALSADRMGAFLKAQAVRDRAERAPMLRSA